MFIHPKSGIDMQNGYIKGNVLNNGLPGIQAQLSPPNQLPKLTDDQLKCVESNFQSNRNPSDLDITIIAAEVGLSEIEVKVRILVSSLQM